MKKLYVGIAFLVTALNSEPVESERIYKRPPVENTGYNMASYIVKKGDTLSEIVKKLEPKIDWKEFYQLNRVIIGKDPNKIYPGQELWYSTGIKRGVHETGN